ncbi:cytochrome b/b6 domain-containing protein [bacterium]|nr:cytochrome b/b6 domain-containing protein [bacterium]
MIQGNSRKYGKPAQLLHWLIATLVFFMSLLGLFMSGQPAGSEKSTLLSIHIATGFVLTVLVVIRVAWKWFDITPAPPDQLSPFNLFAYKTTHVLMYISLFALLTSGITMALSFRISFLPFQIATDIKISRLHLFLFHKSIFVILWCLIAGHIGGVLYYQVKKSDVLSRMGITWFA